jgi:Flp pilus assembly protein TadD
MNTSFTHPVESVIQMIESLKHENNYEGARDTALQALTKYTDDYRLYEELADIYLFENNLDKAEEVIGYARALHPESGTGVYLEWYIAVARGDFDHAIEVLNRANSLMPNNAEVIRNLGWAYVMKGAIPRGLILLRRAHLLAPTEMMIVNDLGVALMASGLEDEARDLFERTGNTLALDAMKAMDA